MRGALLAAGHLKKKKKRKKKKNMKEKTERESVVVLPHLVLSKACAVKGNCWTWWEISPSCSTVMWKPRTTESRIADLVAFAARDKIDPKNSYRKKRKKEKKSTKKNPTQVKKRSSQAPFSTKKPKDAHGDKQEQVFINIFVIPYIMQLHIFGENKSYKHFINRG